MTPLFPAQRAAEEFDQVLGGTATHAVADRYAELLDTVVLLREQPELTPRTDFAAELRSRLMAAAETDLVPAPPVLRPAPAAPSAARRRISTLAASLVIVGGTAGMAAAATGSVPGETLYPVKRGIETASTAVRFSEAAKGRALLDQAATRLDEVAALQRASRPDTTLIATTVDSFRRSADAGSDNLFKAYQATGDPADISAVRTFTTAQMGELAALSDAPTSSVLVDAADTLADIDQQARVLCKSCGPEQPLVPPGSLSAGAGAATVEDLLARPASRVQAEFDAAEAERIRRLTKKAEEGAGKVPEQVNPLVPVPTPGGGTGQAPAPEAGQPGAEDRSPGTSKVVPRDQPPITTTTTTVVKDLVSGVTGTLSGVTGTLLPDTPISDGVKKITDALDKTVESLLPRTR